MEVTTRTKAGVTIIKIGIFEIEVSGCNRGDDHFNLEIKSADKRMMTVRSNRNDYDELEVKAQAFDSTRNQATAFAIGR